MPNIMKAVDFMVNIANDDTHGYDQIIRNGPDYDCSSLVGTALYEAGFDVSPTSWTGNLEQQLRDCGFVDCEAPWEAGDIHLKPYYHVCMSVSENEIAQASINEKGTISGGESGDQTGKEIYVTNYYEYPDGWDMHLRYIGDNDDYDIEYPADVSIETIAREVIAGYWGNGEERKEKLNNAGYDYHEVQALVNALLSGAVLKSNEEIAREVIAGKWGNGAERVEKLTEAGYHYGDVQEIVNEMLGVLTR